MSRAPGALDTLHQSERHPCEALFVHGFKLQVVRLSSSTREPHDLTPPRPDLQAYEFPNVTRAPGALDTLHESERHPKIVQLIEEETARAGCVALREREREREREDLMRSCNRKVCVSLSRKREREREKDLYS